MKIEIWSDIRCPFCYIGKRKLEAALEQFAHKEMVKVEWYSYQLDPDLVTNPGTTTIDYFTTVKGVSQEQAAQMMAHASGMAKEVGLEFHLEDAILANSFNAHRLIQFAKTKDLAPETEEALFKAHLTDKRNIDDMDVLVDIGRAVGLPGQELKDVLASDAFEYEVKQDEMQARNIGVRGVPFFVFNNKYGVPGAQPSEVFLETLEKAWSENSGGAAFEKQTKNACSPGGDCE